jgi:hypothetical protein
MKPESVFVQMPPDLPLFIKNHKRSDKEQPVYRDIWYQFLKRGKDAAFLINPKPKFTSDVILNGEKLKRLFEDNIMPASQEFEIGPTTVYSAGSISS